MIYGIICFATLFSFVGTVLGGIWADQSGKSFWGWIPRKRRAYDRGLERDHFVPMGWVRKGSWYSNFGIIPEYRHRLVMVWREHARHWVAQLRFHGRCFQYLAMVCGDTNSSHACCGAAFMALDEWAILVKLHDRTIGMITASIMGLGILIQFLSFLSKDKSTLYILLLLLEHGRFVLSYMPSHITGTTPKRQQVLR